MAPRIKAVPTRYAGVLFRSRLESRYAVFMDAVGVQWEYEPERVQLPGGGTYLPDFKTADGAYIEVKGAEDALDKPYLIKAAAVLGHLSVLGPIPDCRKGVPGVTVLTVQNGKVSTGITWIDRRPGYPLHPWTEYGWNDAVSKGLIPGEQHPWTAPPSHRWHGPPPPADGYDGRCKGNCPYDAARGARFEHGESGAAR
jgi:hypothetical protein